MMWDKGLLERLNFVLHNDFKRLDYTEGVEILKASGRKFEFPCGLGVRSAVRARALPRGGAFQAPGHLINYPKDIKAFYMKQNDDGKTVRAMDVLFPGIGEIIGGSEREGRLWQASCKGAGARYERTGTLVVSRYPPLGFGTALGLRPGLRRLLLFVTGMTNIRDVQPFPRTPKNAEF